MNSKLKLRFVVIGVILSFISGCAATYHAAEGGSSGYRQLKVDNTTYYVEYTESVNRDWGVIHGFALKRCAEITKENGYKYFDVLLKDEKEVFLDSNVDEISVAGVGTGAPGSWDIPVPSSYSLKGHKVEGRRVIYKIKLTNQ